MKSASILRACARSAAGSRAFVQTPAMRFPLANMAQVRLQSSSSGPAAGAAFKTGPKRKIDNTTKYLLIGGVFFMLMGTLPAMKNNKQYQKALNPDKFLSYTIDTKERASPDSFIMTLRPEEFDASVPIPYLEEPTDASKPATSSGAWRFPLWSVEVKQPEIQIVREYTPLPPSSSAEAKAGILRLLVRVLPDGEVSRFLDRKLPASQVELRGPYPTLLFTSPPDRADDEIVFIAGGSSIAPALQTAHALLETSAAPGKVKILWAVHSRADIDTTAASGAKAVQETQKSWFGGSSLSPSLLDLATDVASPSPVVQQLQALKAAHGVRFDARVAVTGENAVIGDLDVKNALGIDGSVKPGSSAGKRPAPYLPVASGPYSEHQPKVVTRPAGDGAYKLVIVSGPDGFVDKYAGYITQDNAPSYRRLRQGGLVNRVLDGYPESVTGQWQVVNLD